MNGCFLHFVEGFASTFKTRRELVLENWSLRHELCAAQQNLQRAGLERARFAFKQGSSVPAEVKRERGFYAYRTAVNWFRVEESRIGTVLLLIAVLLLGANGLRCFRTFSTPGTTADVWADLDSFSQSSVAEAILRRDAQALLLEYTDSYNTYLQSLDAWNRAYASWSVDESSVASRAVPIFAANYGAMPKFALDKWAERFNRCRASLSNQAIVESLEHGLLLLYEQNRRWPEFLDLYLDIVRKSPDNSDVVDWAQSALTHSRVYGREEEVLAYLQFVAKFGGSPSLARLTPILERWNGARLKPGSPLALHENERTNEV
jgi:hypothetical protein